MKAIVLATLLALLVGLGAGVVLERDRRNHSTHDAAAPSVAAAGEAPASGAADERVAALEAEVAGLSTRLAAIESRPPSAGTASPWTGFPATAHAATDASPQVEAMRTEMAALIAKHDGEGLIFLARRLAALGEAGYPAIMEIAKLLLADETKDPREFGDFDLDNSLFANESAPLMAWSLAHPELSPPAFRSHAIESLAGRNDMDVAHLFLASLRTETDPEIVAKLCDGIAGSMRAGIAEDVEAAARSLRSNEKAIDLLLGALSQLDDGAAQASLKRLTAAEMPAEVRDRARASLAQQSPTGDGYLMLGVETGSGWYTSGLRTGDLIVEMNGAVPAMSTTTFTTTDAKGNTTQLATATDTIASIGEDETVAFRVLRDGETRTVTVHGNDHRWRGAYVRKPE